MNKLISDAEAQEKDGPTPASPDVRFALAVIATFAVAIIAIAVTLSPW